LIFETITRDLKNYLRPDYLDINNEMVSIMNSEADPENKKYFFCNSIYT